MKQLGEPVGSGSDVRPQHTVLQAPQPRTERQMLSEDGWIGAFASEQMLIRLV
jgi:hypothetical protein